MSTDYIRLSSAERTLTLTTVAWCMGDLWHLPEDEIGNACPSTDCERPSNIMQPRVLVRRRMWVCSECSCGSRGQTEAESHECEDCYD
jgi:hypothetical protein